MKAYSIILSACLAAVILAASCNKSLENTFDNQETKLEGIVSSLTSTNDTATVAYQKGSIRVTVVPGSGDSLSSKGAVSFYYAGYYVTGTTISSNNLFATNYDVFANSLNWAVTDSTILAIKTLDLSKDEMVEGLRNGLTGVKGGEECFILFSGKHSFGKHQTGLIPANSALAYHLWIKSVSD